MTDWGAGSTTGGAGSAAEGVSSSVVGAGIEPEDVVGEPAAVDGVLVPDEPVVPEAPDPPAGTSAHADPGPPEPPARRTRRRLEPGRSGWLAGGELAVPVPSGDGDTAGPDVRSSRVGGRRSCRPAKAADVTGLPSRPMTTGDEPDDEADDDAEASSETAGPSSGESSRPER